MQNNRDAETTQIDILANPLRSLTEAQFMALGGNAVAFVRPIKGEALGSLVAKGVFEDELDYQLVMSADGTPLMVADSQEAINDWLSERSFGLVSLH